MKTLQEVAYDKYIADHNSKFIRTVGNWKIIDMCPMDFNLFISYSKLGIFKQFYEG